MPVGRPLRVVLGFLVARTEFPGRRALESPAMVNYALPGTIVGMPTWSPSTTRPSPSRARFILVRLLRVRYSLAGTRATMAVLAQIDPSPRRLGEPGRAP